MQKEQHEKTMTTNNTKTQKRHHLQLKEDKASWLEDECTQIDEYDQELVLVVKGQKACLFLDMQ